MEDQTPHHTRARTASGPAWAVAAAGSGTAAVVLAPSPVTPRARATVPDSLAFPFGVALDLGSALDFGAAFGVAAAAAGTSLDLRSMAFLARLSLYWSWEYWQPLSLHSLPAKRFGHTNTPRSCGVRSL